MVEAAREDPGGVRDLADRRGGVAFLREKITGEPDHVGPALRPHGSVGGDGTRGSAPAGGAALPRRAHPVIIAVTVLASLTLARSAGPHVLRNCTETCSTLPAAIASRSVTPEVGRAGRDTPFDRRREDRHPRRCHSRGPGAGPGPDPGPGRRSVSFGPLRPQRRATPAGTGDPRARGRRRCDRGRRRRG